MAFNLDSLLIDRPLRMTLFDKTDDSVIFSIDQISDPSLECTSESAEVRDAIGGKITEFDRSKDATFTGNGSVANLGLMAAQLGSEKVVASSNTKILVPKFEMIEIGETGGVVNTTITLKETPKTPIKHIYRLTRDKSIAEGFEVGIDPATDFSISGKVITLPTDPTFTAADRFGIWYDYEADGSTGKGAVRISNTAKAFARSGRCDLEVLFADVCNPDRKFYGHIISENAKMDGNTTINFGDGSTQPFNVKIMQDYCASDNKLFDIIIPE